MPAAGTPLPWDRGNGPCVMAPPHLRGWAEEAAAFLSRRGMDGITAFATSGSSGSPPKAILFTRRALDICARGALEHLHAESGDWCCPLPLWHVGGAMIYLRAALPGGLSDLLLILGIEAFVFAFELPIGTLTTLTTLLLLAVGMAVLWDVCKPFTVAHGVLWGGMLILAGAAIALLGGFLGLERLDMRGMLILIAFLLLVVQTLHSMERGLTAVGDAATLVWKRLPRKSKAEENY